MSLLSTELANYFANATARELRLAGKNFRNVVESYRDIALNGAALGKINAFLAAEMRAAVLTAYQNNVLSRSVGPYREGDRYSGKLLTALESPTMAQGSARGIGFIDSELLDNNARHWQRLNFGAGPAEGSLPRPRARIQFGSNQGFSLALPDAPRPNFEVPSTPGEVGYFNSQGQFHMGFPQGGDRGNAIIVHRRLSRRGIGARRFLDAGLVALAEGFKPAYKAHFEDAARQAASKAANEKFF